MHLLQLISILLEAAITVIAVLAAMKRRPYLYGLAITFGIYVYYDLARLYSWDFLSGFLPFFFFIATVSALISVWGLYQKR